MTALPGPVQWTLARVPITVVAEPGGRFIEGLGLGLRDNPNRAHLLVNPLLAKHVPVPPSDPVGVADALARQVRPGMTSADPLVIGFAETATGLGWFFARALAAALGVGAVDYIHSTRQTGTPGGPVDQIEFNEAHSHATNHRIQPAKQDFLRNRREIVLVDDEVTSGAMALELAYKLSDVNPGCRFTLACLVDGRPESNNLAERASSLGLDLTIASLARVVVAVSDGARSRVAALARLFAVGGVEPSRAHMAKPQAPSRECLREVVLPVPSEHPRHGQRVGAESSRGVARAIVSALPGEVRQAGRVWIVGEEEEIAMAVLVAEEWGQQSPGTCVLVSSCTRSPALVVGSAYYPMRTAIHYRVRDGGLRFLYNGVTDADAVLFIPDPHGQGAPSDLLRQLPGRVWMVRWAPHSPVAGTAGVL